MSNLKYEFKDYKDSDSDYTRNTLTQYIRSISDIPVLDDDSFEKLYYEYKNGSSVAFNKIIESNLKLVLKVAYKYSHNQLPFLDLICEGNIGLFEALKRYDITRAKFSTYAYKWIDRAIRMGIMDKSRNVKFPYRTYEKLVEYKKFLNDYCSMYSDYPSDEVIMDSIGVTKNTLFSLKLFANDTTSLDVGFSFEDGDEKEGVEVISDDNVVGPEKFVLDNELRSTILELLNHVDERERRVLELRFGFNGEPLTFEQIGNMFGLTRQRISQIYLKALKKMRCYLNEREYVIQHSDNNIRVSETNFSDLENLIVSRLFSNSGDGCDINSVINMDELSCFEEDKKLEFVNSVIRKYVSSYKRNVSRR